MRNPERSSESNPGSLGIDYMIPEVNKRYRIRESRIYPQSLDSKGWESRTTGPQICFRRPGTIRIPRCMQLTNPESLPVGTHPPPGNDHRRFDSCDFLRVLCRAPLGLNSWTGGGCNVRTMISPKEFARDFHAGWDGSGCNAMGWNGVEWDGMEWGGGAKMEWNMMECHEMILNILEYH